MSLPGTSRLERESEMDTGLQDSLRSLYQQGVRRGRLEARIDQRGTVALAFVIGAALGIVGGLGVTGWL